MRTRWSRRLLRPLGGSWLLLRLIRPVLPPRPEPFNSIVNPENFSTSSRRTFIKRSAYSAVATSFAFCSTAVLTSCQSPGMYPFPGGDWYSPPSSMGGLLVQEVDGGVIITNTTDHSVQISGISGETVTIPAGESLFVPTQP
jgi:hypothetical protein